MMRLSAVLVLGVLVGDAGATIVNFDDVDVPYVNVVNNVWAWQLKLSQGHYDHEGLWFRTDTAAGAKLYYSRGFEGSFETDTMPNFVYASDYYGLIANRPIYIDFILPDSNPEENFEWQPVRQVAFMVIDSASDTAGTWTAQARDINGVVIETITGKASNVPVVFDHPAADIYTVAFIPSSDLEAIDTLRVNELPTCPADFNHDSFVNALDYDEFAGFFEIGDPAADFNTDGFVNAIDYDLFASHFESGC
ncbi:MAG: hypothetical protein IT432_02700 [Phycisphaerales bacterium]|nr:hypothetical protein [Phycisphaerales bacterium]